MNKEIVWRYFDYPRTFAEAYALAYAILEDNNCHRENRELVAMFGYPDSVFYPSGIQKFSEAINYDICSAIYAASVVTEGAGELYEVLTAMALDC